MIFFGLDFGFGFLVWILGIGFQGPCCLLGDLAVSGAEIMVPTCLLRFTLRILFFGLDLEEFFFYFWIKMIFYNFRVMMII